MALVENEFWRDFIEAYKNEKVLWEMKNDYYKCKLKRSQSWQILLKKYKEVDRHATLDTLKKRINGMRNCYRRELSKIKKSERSAHDEEDIYKPKLWYFHQLDFLREMTETGTSEVNDFESAEDFQNRRDSRKRMCSENNSESCENATHHLDEPRQTKRQLLERTTQHLDGAKNRQTKREFLEKTTQHLDGAKNRQTKREFLEKTTQHLDGAKISQMKQQFLQKPTHHLNEVKSRPPKRDDADVFAESWALLFRKLSPEQQIYAKRGIDEILVHGQLGNLDINCAKINVRQRKPKTYTMSRASSPNTSLSSISDPLTTSPIHSP